MRALGLGIRTGSIQTCVCVMVVKARSSSLGAAVAAAPTGVRPGYVIAPQPCVQQGYVLVWVVTGAVAVVVVIGAVLVVVVVPTVVGHTWGHGSAVYPRQLADESGRGRKGGKTNWCCG